MATRPGTHRARLPHEPRSGFHRRQAFPLRARRLPARVYATSGGVHGWHSAAQDALTARAVPTCSCTDCCGALDAPCSACGGTGQRACDADACARAGARGTYA